MLSSPIVENLMSRSPESDQNGKENDFCGMWKDREEMEDVEAYVRRKRKGRVFWSILTY